MLAAKLPAWCMKEAADRDRIFREQLDRCGVDYFDFYLLHSVKDGGKTGPHVIRAFFAEGGRDDGQAPEWDRAPNGQHNGTMDPAGSRRWAN